MAEGERPVNRALAKICESTSDLPTGALREQVFALAVELDARTY
jgi:hypothetical protein